MCSPNVLSSSDIMGEFSLPVTCLGKAYSLPALQCRPLPSTTEADHREQKTSFEAAITSHYFVSVWARVSGQVCYGSINETLYPIFEHNFLRNGFFAIFHTSYP